MVSGPTLSSRLIRRASILYFDLENWRVEGRAPAAKKFVIVGAPHTSNRDFLVFLAATDKLGISPSFIGKHSLFRGPLKRLMFDMGGIPIDRSKRANYVDQVVAEFGKRDELALVIAPEGTRGSDGHWKSGFYHIALGADVPIVPAWLDLEQRRVKIGAPIVPSGDYAADITRIAEFFRAIDPTNPRFSMIDRDAAPEPPLSKSHPGKLGGRT